LGWLADRRKTLLLRKLLAELLPHLPQDFILQVSQKMAEGSLSQQEVEGLIQELSTLRRLASLSPEHLSRKGFSLRREVEEFYRAFLEKEKVR